MTPTLGPGASLHVCSTPHGPDASSYAGALAADTSKPVRLPDGALAFMFETSALLQLTAYAVDEAKAAVQPNYAQCWQGLPRASVPGTAPLS